MTTNRRTIVKMNTIEIMEWSNLEGGSRSRSRIQSQIVSRRKYF